MDEILTRVWENLIGRVSGPMNFRLIMQPIMAGLFAIRAGLKDCREGKAPYLWAVFSNHSHRADLLRQGWKGAGRIFILAVVLDVVYQLIAFHRFYPGEALVVASVLALVPYILLRGPVNRLGRLFSNANEIKNQTSNQKEEQT